MLSQHTSVSKQRLLAGALALIFILVALAACAPGARTPAPASRNHVPKDVAALFVQITFTNDTTYDQAAALLQQVGSFPSLWNCDDPPRNATPPTPAQQRAGFDSGHTLLISYPTQDQLNTLAQSDLVTSIDAIGVTMCSG
jgi:hypothetical protein